jgi:hypothetical protein
VNRKTAAMLAAAASILGTPAGAEVTSSAFNGFTVRHVVPVAADRASVYAAAVGDIGRWWSSEHTVSGDAANLYMTTTLPGCFCEKLGERGGLVHMTVSFVNPGSMIRLTGGLGPLGLTGVAGNMTWEFEEAGDGTVVTLNYSVGGYMDGGLENMARAVDAVLGEAMQRLRSYVETGDPGQA